MSDERERTKVDDDERTKVDEDFEGHKLDEGDEVDPGRVGPGRFANEPDEDDFEGHKLTTDKVVDKTTDT